MFIIRSNTINNNGKKLIEYENKVQICSYEQLRFMTIQNYLHTLLTKQKRLVTQDILV